MIYAGVASHDSHVDAIASHRSESLWVGDRVVSTDVGDDVPRAFGGVPLHEGSADVSPTGLCNGVEI
jgi:hypothetical protein